MNAESPSLGLNVVSHHNIHAGSNIVLKNLIFFEVCFYAQGGGGLYSLTLERGANLLIWGLQFESGQIICGLKTRGPKCAICGLKLGVGGVWYL